MTLREGLAVLLAIAVAVTVLVTAPQFGSLYQGFRLEPPAATRVMLAAYPYILLLPMVVVALLVGGRGAHPTRRSFPRLAFLISGAVLLLFLGAAWLPMVSACGAIC